MVGPDGCMKGSLWQQLRSPWFWLPILIALVFYLASPVEIWGVVLEGLFMPVFGWASGVALLFTWEDFKRDFSIGKKRDGEEA